MLDVADESLSDFADKVTRASRRSAYDKRYYEKNREKRIADGVQRAKANPDKVKKHRDAYYEKNKEAILKKNAEFKKAHKAEVKALWKKWASSNRERLLAKKRAYNKANADALKAAASARNSMLTAAKKLLRDAWCKANADRIAEEKNAKRKKAKEAARIRRAAYYEANKLRIKAQAAAWASENKDAVNASRHTRRAKQKNSGGKYTAKDVASLFEKQAGKCPYCRKRLKRGYHVDHIVPLAKGGSNLPTNIQLTCARCNLRKRDKDPFVFAQENGRLL